MSDSGKKETLSLSRRPGRVDARRTVESGQVKQSFSHGRSKTVQVEVVRKKRAIGKPAASPAEERAEQQAAPQPAPAAPRPPAPAGEEAAPPPRAEPKQVQQVQPTEAVRAAPPKPTPPRVRHILPTLSDREKVSRLKAVEQAAKADAESRRRAEEDARRRAEEEARQQVERAAAERRRQEEEQRRRADDEGEKVRARSGGPGSATNPREGRGHRRPIDTDAAGLSGSAATSIPSGAPFRQAPSPAETGSGRP